MTATIQVLPKAQIRDVKGEQVAQKAAQQLGIETGRVKTAKLFAINYDTTDERLARYAQECIRDAVTDRIVLNEWAHPANFQSFIAVAQLPGVTDDEGMSAQMAWADYFNTDTDVHTQRIFTQALYYFEKRLSVAALEKIAKRLLGNPLINHFRYAHCTSEGEWNVEAYVPEVRMTTDTTVNIIDLNRSDEELLQLSKEMVLALNLAEMKAIVAHYRSATIIEVRMAIGLPANPTDCELEILGQTWSEHCKHKEFNAIIHYKDAQTGEQYTIDSLFKTFIKGTTSKVQESLENNGNNWLVKVFSDNAGVVKATDDQLFVWKVETHNSPSALDPYGGAITGILGNNRDPLGTGVGGARLLFNTNVLCFGNPNYDKPLLTGQLHPRQILEGVVAGIEDGGNKSGVPTVNGSVVFDDRYSGKPLVYCGTGALMPYDYQGAPSWEKPIDAQDRIIVIGGRVGKDGIHGATFSSIEIDEHSPSSAVQIGSPITQKKVADFMIKATRQGLVKCSTDNGAGGLSSSIGELATISGGAVVQLEKVPLKYAGLKPWEIFVSESQERMTLVIEPGRTAALLALAAKMEVEATDIGYFTDAGYLDVRYDTQQVAYLNMHFLHEGDPQKIMQAEWVKPQLKEPTLHPNLAYDHLLLRLMGSLNICSRESIIRRYDHEVKGKTIVKPLMGPEGKAPQDAAVLRFGFDSYEGIAVSNGILPRYGDIDAYEMSAGAFDEAVRQIISAGGSLPNVHAGDGIFWSVNDNFCVPDSDYHPESNPDGKQKLAKLVQMCQALYDMATYFDIPLTSGKDSMKNDFKADGVKISVPPTILYSMTAKMNDVRRSVTSEFKAAGDVVYQLGTTYNELGGSELYQLFGELGANVPRVRKEAAKALYKKIMQANANGLIASSHDLSDGGLAVALTESAFGGSFGVDIDLAGVGQGLTKVVKLFSESHSRFLVSVKAEDQAAFEAILGKEAHRLGVVTACKRVVVKSNGQTLINLSTKELQQAWSEGLYL